MKITRGHVESGALHRTAETEQRHHHAEAELAIEIGAADPHAVIGQNVRAAIGFAMALWSEPDDREVRGAAADVGDQGDFFRGELALVIQRRGDRLELEGDFVEADFAGDLAQGLLGLAVRVRRIVDEVHGAAMHDVAQLAAGRLFGTALYRAKVIGDDVAKPDAFASQSCGLLDQRRTEHRFQAAHQPAGRAIDIGLDGLAADQHLAVDFIENGARNCGMTGLQRDQDRRLVFDHAECRVRGSEIKSADRHGRSRRSVRLHIKPPSIHLYLAMQHVGGFERKRSSDGAGSGHPQINLFGVTG